MVKDKLGFQLDENVSYARGNILQDSMSETHKMITGRKLIQKRVEKFGRDGVYNLTGLSRSFPLTSEDLNHLKSQVEFFANYEGALNEIAIPFVGGEKKRDKSILLNRITSSMIAIMQSLVGEGNTLVSWVPKGRSHPSIEKACNLIGVKFYETTNLEEFEDMILRYNPIMAVITPFTHAKFHAKIEDTKKAISIASNNNSLVMVDDAHMVARITVFNEPPSLKLGNVDVAVLSPDKHMWGPRAGLVSGRKDLVDKIEASGFSNGIDAQNGNQVAVINAIKFFNPDEIVEAGDVAKKILDKVIDRFPNSGAYLAGPGIGINEYDLYRLVYSNQIPDNSYTPIEVSSAVCMTMLRQEGILTIPTVGMPGSSPALRLMMFSDGKKLGTERAVNNLESAIKNVRNTTKKEDFANIIFGQNL